MATSTLKQKPASRPVSVATPASDGRRLVPAEIGMTLALTVALAALSIAALSLIFFLGSKRVHPIAVDATGRVIPVVSLDNPMLTDTRVSGFVDECLRRSFSHDFENFRQTVNAAKECYTPAGSREFDQAISPLLEDLQRMQIVMSVSLEASVVVNKYVRNGIYVWEVQTPMTLFRRGSRESIAPIRYLVTSNVMRVPLEHDVRGIAIRSIIIRPHGSR